LVPATSNEGLKQWQKRERDAVTVLRKRLGAGPRKGGAKAKIGREDLHKAGCQTTSHGKRVRKWFKKKKKGRSTSLCSSGGKLAVMYVGRKAGGKKKSGGRKRGLARSRAGKKKQAFAGGLGYSWAARL